MTSQQSGRSEPVADAVLGQDILWMVRILFQFISQSVDIAFEIRDFVRVLTSPDVRQQCLVRYYLAGVADQVVEQAILGTGECHRLAADQHLTPGKIHLNFAAGKGTFVDEWQGLGPSQYGSDTGQQLQVAEWLGHI